jgi:hypothetical protein
VQKVQYVAEIGPGKRPGEIAESHTAIGNQDFNAGKKGVNMYGYDILKLWEVCQENKKGVSVMKMKRAYI